MRQHLQVDLANKQVRRKMILFMMIRTIFMEICGNLSKKCKRKLTKSEYLFWILKVSWLENIATPPISNVFAFLTKCICNLILRPFFTKYPKREHFISSFLRNFFYRGKLVTLSCIYCCTCPIDEVFA